MPKRATTPDYDRDDVVPFLAVYAVVAAVAFVTWVSQVGGPERALELIWRALP